MNPNSARAFKRILQADIDSGAVADHTAMFSRITERGFEVRRNGEDYVSFKDSDGLKARVYFSFENPTATRRNSLSMERRKQRHRHAVGCYVYALVAISSSSVAFYVGQTIRLDRRMRDHLRTAASDRSSGKLFEYACEHGCDVRVAILEVVPKAAIDMHDFRLSALIESSWFLRAENAGMELPGSETWGLRAKEAKNATAPWPLDEIVARAIPVRLVAETDVDPADYAISGYDAAMMSSGAESKS